MKCILTALCVFVLAANAFAQGPNNATLRVTVVDPSSAPSWPAPRFQASRLGRRVDRLRTLKLNHHDLSDSEPRTSCPVESEQLVIEGAGFENRRDAR
jgi:hypothetical protein